MFTSAAIALVVAGEAIGILVVSDRPGQGQQA
jgi:hypothetical protein